ncbi:MAG: type II secretion system protein [Candidatus Scatovivens sp.]
MKNQNGVTLVALIITIIVMLILAGVTISMVISDGGVLEQAKSADAKQKLAEEKEKIVLSQMYITEGENAGKVSLKDTKVELLNLGYEEVDFDSSEEGKLKVTLKNPIDSETIIELENVINDDDGG